MLTDLGSLHYRQFQRLWGLSDINKAVSLSEEAVGLILDVNPSKPWDLTNLGNSFCRRFDGLSPNGNLETRHQDGCQSI